MNQWELFRFESPHHCFLRAMLTAVLSHPQICSQSNQLLPRMLSTKHSSMNRTAKCFPPTRIENSRPHPEWGPWASATLVGATLEIPILCMIWQGLLILKGCSTQRPSFGVCLIPDKAWIIFTLIVSSGQCHPWDIPVFSCRRIRTELVNRQCWVQKTDCGLLRCLHFEDPPISYPEMEQGRHRIQVGCGPQGNGFLLLSSRFVSHLLALATMTLTMVLSTSVLEPQALLLNTAS